MQFQLAVILASVLSVVSGQVSIGTNASVTVNLGGTAAPPSSGGLTGTLSGVTSGLTSTVGGVLGGLTGTLGGVTSGLTSTLGSTTGTVTSTASSLPSAVSTTVGGAVASVSVGGTTLLAESFSLINSVVSVVPTVVDSLGLGPNLAAAPSVVQGLVINATSAVAAGVGSIVLTLAAPTFTVVDVFTSPVAGVVGPLLASVPLTSVLPPLTTPSPPTTVPTLPTFPLPTASDLAGVLPTVLGSVLGTVGSLLPSTSPGVVGSILVPLSNNKIITLLVDGNVLNILNITLNFKK